MNMVVDRLRDSEDLRRSIGSGRGGYGFWQYPKFTISVLFEGFVQWQVLGSCQAEDPVRKLFSGYIRSCSIVEQHPYSRKSLS